MAYVYRHIRLDKNEVFYIGIGITNNYKRAYSVECRNKIWQRIVAKTAYEVEIMLDDLTWEEACEKEKEFISLYKRIFDKGILANMATGGEGAIGVIKTKEAIEKTANKNRVFPFLIEPQRRDFFTFIVLHFIRYNIKELA